MSCVAALIQLTFWCSGLVPFFDACIQVVRLPSCCEHNNYIHLGTNPHRGELEKMPIDSLNFQLASSGGLHLCKELREASFVAIRELRPRLLGGFPDDAHRLSYTPYACSYDTKYICSSYGPVRRGGLSNVSLNGFDHSGPGCRRVVCLRQQQFYWKHGV